MKIIKMNEMNNNNSNSRMEEKKLQKNKQQQQQQQIDRNYRDRVSIWPRIGCFSRITDGCRVYPLKSVFPFPPFYFFFF